MNTESNQQKSSQILTEKQIIKQLKCLIAKQQQQINKLIHEVQRLKNQRKVYSDFPQNYSIAFGNLQSSRALQNGLHSKQNLSKDFPDFAPLIHSKSLNNHQSKDSQSFQIEETLKNFQKYIKEFRTKVLKRLQEKYLSSQKILHFNQNQQVFKLQANLKQAHYESLGSFLRFFPHLLRQTKITLNHMDHKIEQMFQIENSLTKKIKEQEKILKQMMSQYEKNIIESQKMQTKLLNEIKRLNQTNNLRFTQNFTLSNHNYQQKYILNNQ